MRGMQSIGQILMVRSMSDNRGQGVLMKSKKVMIAAKFMNTSGVSSLGFAALRMAIRAKHIRVINYHRTSPEHADNFERQLQFYQRLYSPVCLDELAGFFRGEWLHKKPGLIISFDDGYRSNYEVAKPLLEKYGFTGWFFVASGLVRTEDGQHTSYMNWDEVRELASSHVVGCHTHTHKRLSPDVPADVMQKEIVDSKKLMEQKLGIGKPIDSFCWVGGEEENYSAEAAQLIRHGGYRYSFMTNCAPLTPKTDPLQIQRTNIEADWPLELVKFYLSGLVDLLYTGKRKRVNELTKAEGDDG